MVDKGKHECTPMAPHLCTIASTYGASNFQTHAQRERIILFIDVLLSFFVFFFRYFGTKICRAHCVLVENRADISANRGVNEIKCVRVWMRCYSECQPSKQRISCCSQPDRIKKQPDRVEAKLPRGKLSR